MTAFEPTLECARALDDGDPLRDFRARFHVPRTARGDETAYLCGNSLGLQPMSARAEVIAVLDDWARLGVQGHFQGDRPWFDYHERATDAAAHIVGARPDEVVMMGSLTGNLHAALVSFYRPTRARFRIAIEADAFPSDRYAVASHARFHGIDPEEALVELRPRPGEQTIREDDIVSYLEASGETVALLLLGGVNYLTGQAFDLARLSRAAHTVGAVAGFDLAHAAGNIPLQLHQAGVDFAVWCSYKYLNSGPGGVAGLFVHERHGQNADLPRFAGWWGNDPSTRFSMPRAFVPAAGARGWQVSNAPVLPLAAFVASGVTFLEATMPRLREKSLRLSAYLDALLDAAELPIERITPRAPERRGCQLSLRIPSGAERLRAALDDAGVVCDVRPPNVIRLAPVPLYSSFEDVFRFFDALRGALADA